RVVRRDGAPRRPARIDSRALPDLVSVAASGRPRPALTRAWAGRERDRRARVARGRRRAALRAGGRRRSSRCFPERADLGQAAPELATGDAREALELRLHLVEREAERLTSHEVAREHRPDVRDVALEAA